MAGSSGLPQNIRKQVGASGEAASYSSPNLQRTIKSVEKASRVLSYIAAHRIPAGFITHSAGTARGNQGCNLRAFGSIQDLASTLDEGAGQTVQSLLAGRDKNECNSELCKGAIDRFIRPFSNLFNLHDGNPSF